MSTVGDRQKCLNFIATKTIAVIGCGGIGNWAALMVALCGRFHVLHLVDGDTIEETNLNRTVFRLKDIGSYKVFALKDIIGERSTAGEVLAHPYKTTDEEFAKTFAEIKATCDVIFDCRDNIFTDLSDFKKKVYKVGYDGTSITVDGNPSETHILGEGTRGYQVTPSYAGSSMLAAVIAVNDGLLRKAKWQVDETNQGDKNDRFNTCVTFDAMTLLSTLTKNPHPGDPDV